MVNMIGNIGADLDHGPSDGMSDLLGEFDCSFTTARSDLVAA